MKVQSVKEIIPAPRTISVKVGPRYFATIEELVKVLNTKIAKKVTSLTNMVVFAHTGGITKMKLGGNVASIDLGNNMQQLFGGGIHTEY